MNISKTLLGLSAVMAWGLMCVLQGCGSSGAYETDREIDLRTSEWAEPDSVAVDQILFPWGIRVADSTLVILNIKRDTVFDAYNLPDLAYIGSGVTRGAGPAEIINVNPMSLGVHDGFPYIMTGMPGEIVYVQIPRPEVRRKTTAMLPSGWSGHQQLLPLGGDTVLMQRDLPPLEWVMVDGSGQVIAELDVPMPDALANNIAANNIVGAIKAKQAIVLVTPDCSRIAICTSSYPSVNIFDREGNRLSTVTMPYDPALSGPWIISGDATDDRFYINYHDPSDSGFKEFTIASITVDGILDKSVKLPGPVGAIAVDRHSGMMYYTGGGENNYIYRVKI